MKSSLFGWTLFLVSLLAVIPVRLSAQEADADSLGVENMQKSKTASAWQHETSYAGVPLFVAGALIGLEQTDYRSMRNAFIPRFNSTLDNFSQYSPLAVTALLKLCGVKTRSSWGKLGVSSAFSAAFMATMVNGIKYSAKEMRPDNSTRNSFPSGHTATSFMSATIMSKELGWRSPWYSIGAYTVATTTGLFRIFNNRHWVNDVVFGAGIGITSVDLGYFVSDLIFKEKRFPTGFYGQKSSISLPEKPSFISMGMSLGYMNNIAAPDIYDDYNDDMTPASGATPLDLKLHVGATSSLVVEGAYFANSHFGVGGRLRAMACPITAEYNSKFQPYVFESEGNKYKFYDLKNIESASLGLVTVDVGPYFSQPITPRLNLGGKLLIGDCITTDFDLNSYSELSNYYRNIIDNEYANGGMDKDDYYELTEGIEDREFMHISTNHAVSMGVGLSLTFAVKANSAIRAFVDYSHVASKYTYHFYNRLVDDDSEDGLFIEDTFEKRAHLNSFNFGISMLATF